MFQIAVHTALCCSFHGFPACFSKLYGVLRSSVACIFSSCSTGKPSGCQRESKTYTFDILVCTNRDTGYIVTCGVEVLDRLILFIKNVEVFICIDTA